MSQIVNVGHYQQQTGAYSIVGKTGSMAAGLAAASPIFCFRWDPTTAGLRAVVDRIRVSVASLATGFAAGVGYLEAVAARSFTVPDYGGKAAPTTTSAVSSESGGTLAAGTYYYSLSALGAWGETALGTERSGAAITGSTGSVTFTYSNYTNATTHRVWRGTSAGTYTHYQDDAASTFVDTGAGWTEGVPGQVAGGGTGLTLTTNNAKRQTVMPTTELAAARISDTITMTAGTRTLDAQPFAATQFTVGTAVQTLAFEGDLYRADQWTYPLIFAADEGFILRATVPATGVWSGVITVDWREVK